jgi:predicted RNA binding protein YcfA (HicA-like mRNA interferase family)
MPRFGPIKRRELIGSLRRAGFVGPFAGGKHEFMQRGELSLTVPNPPGSDIGPKLLNQVLRQACISREEGR